MPARDHIDSLDVLNEIARLEQEILKEERFVSDVSHELRSPIAELRAQLEEVQLYPDEASLREALDRALGEVDRLEAIITDLLLLARVEAGGRTTLERVDLAELVVTEVAGRTDRLAPRLRLEPGMVVDADRTQLRRALSDLLDNAQRHAERTVEIEVGRDGAGAELTVTDDGPGIAADDREKIFEKFVRLSAGRDLDSAGTGLGLAVSHEIARAHSGRLQVEDSPTGGARFTLRLPLA